MSGMSGTGRYFNGPIEKGQGLIPMLGTPNNNAQLAGIMLSTPNNNSQLAGIMSAS